MAAGGPGTVTGIASDNAASTVARIQKFLTGRRVMAPRHPYTLVTTTAVIHTEAGLQNSVPV